MHLLCLLASTLEVTLPPLVQEATADTDKYDEQFDEDGERRQ